MRLNPLIKKKLDTINPKRFSKYLEANNWVLDSKLSDIALIWHRKEEEYSNYEILMPTSKSLKDYNDRLLEAIDILADFYNKELLTVINDIIGFYTDIIKIQLIHSDVEDGTILFEDGIKLIDNAHDMLNAAALSTLSKKKSFSGNKPNEVTDFLDSLRLGQTEVGSYIINILAPLNFEEEFTLFGEQNISFERKITKTLSNGLKSLKNATEEYKVTREFSVFLETIDKGVSSNLCKAVSELSGENRDKKVNIEIEYFNSIDKPQKVHKYDFEKEEVQIIEEAASYLDEDFWFEQYTIQGFVTRLARDEDDEEGKITLDCYVEDKRKKVNVNLNKKQYDKAILAHKNENKLICIGDLHMKPRYSTMVNVIDIKIIGAENNGNNKLF